MLINETVDRAIELVFVCIFLPSVFVFAILIAQFFTTCTSCVYVHVQVTCFVHNNLHDVLFSARVNHIHRYSV